MTVIFIFFYLKQNHNLEKTSVDKGQFDSPRITFCRGLPVFTEPHAFTWLVPQWVAR